MREIRLHSLPILAAAAAVAATVAGCNVCGPDRRSVLTEAESGFTVTRGARTAEPTTLNSSVQDQQLGTGQFQSLWDVFARGRQPYPAVAITATGGSGSQMVGLVLALPTPVRSGQHLAVGAAFPPPDEPYVMYWSTCGSHPLRTAGQAEIGLRVSDFSPTGGPTNTFVATTATGTIDVAEVDGHTFRLQLDVVAGDAAGETVRLRGPVVVRLQTEPAVCFS
jgi:hypothetical protein